MNDENKFQESGFTSLLVENVVRNIGDNWAVIFEKCCEKHLNLLRSNGTNSKFVQHHLENGYTFGKMYDNGNNVF
jgi:hypothetical protein